LIRGEEKLEEGGLKRGKKKTPILQELRRKGYIELKREDNR